MREGHRRAAAVVVPNERLARGFFSGFGHLSGTVERVGQRLLAGDVLAGLQRGDRMLGMNIVGRHHIDQVDLGIVDGGLPVGARILPAPAVGEFG